VSASDPGAGLPAATGLEVVEVGALVTVQDAGRPGLAHLGVPRAGWLDAPAAALANRLAGAAVGSAVLEVTLGGVALRAGAATWVAVTGAPCAVSVDGRPAGHGTPVRLPAGGLLRLGPAQGGVRTYLGVAGGIAVDPVLGSRSTDTLSWTGPPRVEPGAVLPVGTPVGPPAFADVPAPAPAPTAALVVDPGPRADWCVDSVAHLCGSAYVVTTDSDRVGLRLDGAPLRRAPGREGQELASEGVALGSVQVPPDGRPVVFLADHPTTGGYPVVAVVREAGLARCAQLRPGAQVRFTRS